MDSEATGQKVAKVVQLERPRHAEQYSLEECGAFQPWHVILKVIMREDDFEITDYEIYLRAPTPYSAQWTAYAVFNILEKDQQGLPHDAEYPDVCHTGSTAEAISEEEYKEAWKEAQYYPHVKGGMQENPSVFRFVRTGKFVNEFANSSERKIISTASELTAREVAEAKAKMRAIDAAAAKKGR